MHTECSVAKSPCAYEKAAIKNVMRVPLSLLKKPVSRPLDEPLLSSQKALNFDKAGDWIFGFKSREASARFQEFAVFDGLGKFAD